MTQPLILILLLANPPGGAVVIDRIAVIVGKHALKLSDIDRDIRVTAFLNRQPFSETGDEKRKAAQRLIDQQLIRDEIATGGYRRATDAEVDAMLRPIVQSRYAGSDVRLKGALEQYGLTDDQLRAQLLWQSTVLRFIDQRFRPGVLVTDDEVKAYYDQHPALQKIPFEGAAPQIRTTLEGERINQEFESCLDAARKGSRIEFREEAFK
jgi:peptidyl-prolyl cis-trans isomerase SurA